MSTQSINSILDSFEVAWAGGPVPRIDDYMDKLRKFDDLDACVGVCAADLEWRWKTFYPKNDLPQCFRAETYWRRFPELFVLTSNCDTILHAEWLARSRWGDAPNVDDFISDSGFPSKCVAQNVKQESVCLELIRSLDEIAPLVTSAVRADDKLRFICPPQYEIGRRRKPEPPPFAWLEPLNRLVIADDEELTVSRKQLVVRRIRLNEVELTNVSKKVTISIEQEKLEPGMRARIETPFSIRLLDIHIVIESG